MKTDKSSAIIALLLVVLFFTSAPPAVFAGSREDQIELRMAVRMQIPSIDPINQSNNWEYVAAVNIYDTLVYPDPNPRILVKPWIAKAWKISDDAKTYTFQLREDVKFHDGSELTAEDVAFSMDRQQTLGGQISTYFKTLKPGSTEVLDRYTVAFHLEQPDPAFLASLVLFKILNKNLLLKNKESGKYGKFGDYSVRWIDTQDAGSGPYKVVQRIHGDRLVLEKFKDYSLTQWTSNSIDKVVLYTTPEIVTIATRMKKGEVDIIDWTLPPEVIKDLQQKEGIKVEFDYIDTNWFIILNNKKPPLDDKYVRKAIAYAFDYETVIKDILAGGLRSQGPVPNKVAGHNDNLLVYKIDIDKAKELLKKSKYSKADLLKFQLELAAVAGNQNFINIGLLAAANLKEIGLNVRVQEYRWADICQHQGKPDTAFHMTVFYQSGKVPHPQQFLVFYTPEGWGTAYPPGGMYYQNPQVTELLHKAKTSSSMEDQFKYYAKAQEIIVDDSPSLFLHNDLLTQPIWRYVKGYKMAVGAFYYQLRFDKFWMDTSDKFYMLNHRK